MTGKPIIFSAPMVRALLAGKKTQTRRTLKRQPPHDCGLIEGPGLYATKAIDRFGNMEAGLEVYGVWSEDGEWGAKLPYQPDDRLWVREAWRTDIDFDSYSPKSIEKMCVDAGYKSAWCPIQFEADGKKVNWDTLDEAGRLRPSMFMSRWASRITLEVTDVRVERLNEISEEDARAEGAGLYVPGHGFIDRHDLAEGYSNYLAPRQGFEVLWDSINAKRPRCAWRDNPWVSVTTFRVIT
jgi:hypothetical protein